MRPLHFFILVLVGVVLAFAPLAFAYDLPETVLVDQQYNARYVQQQRQKHIDESIARHTEPATKDTAVAEERSSAPAHAATTEPSESPAPDGSETVTVNARTARLLKRLDEKGSENDVLSPTLHHGAPLSPTGMGSAIATVLAMIAIGWTLMRARKPGKE